MTNYSKLNMPKRISLLLLIAFSTLVACENNKQTGTVKEAEPTEKATISIQYHTEETLQKYKNAVNKLDEVRNEKQYEDSVKHAQQVKNQTGTER